MIRIQRTPSKKQKHFKRLRLSHPIYRTPVHGERSPTQPYKPPSGPSWQRFLEPIYEPLPLTTPETSCPKRPQAPPAGLRPYVSKRRRLMTQPESTQLHQEAASSNLQATDSYRLSEVSETVRPYIGRKTGRTELPKRVQHHLHAHQGPVNTVQWCPVVHLSHLLLSASMDKTFKVSWWPMS